MAIIMSVVLSLVLVLFFSGAQAISRSGLLQFGGGDNTLTTGDDAIARIRLSSPFVFYGTSYNDLFVSQHVSFINIFSS